MRPFRAFAIFATLLATSGCPLAQQSAPARAQEAASELNLNTRFGRMELAAEHVDPKAKDSFFERRRTWGNRIRVADYELAGLKMKGEEDADVFVKIAWFRVDEGDLRTTTLKQKWHSFKGAWRLVEENRLDGDAGLLGETIEAVRPANRPKNVHFPTVRLGTEPPEQPASEVPSKTPTEAVAPTEPAPAAPPAGPTLTN